MTDAIPSVATTEVTRPPVEQRRLREAAAAFETLFVQTLVRQMREAQLEQGFFGDGPGSSIYEGMFEQYLSEQLASGSPLGISRLLEEQWSERIPDDASVESVEQQIETLRARRTYENSIDAAPSVTPRPAGEFSRSFGWGVDPIDGSRRFHEGVDLPAPSGTPVVAVAAGRVIGVDRQPGYGLQVRVEHARSWTTRYAHLATSDVRVGQSLARGERVGSVGRSGRTTGPHLHFEASLNGRSVDPKLAAPGPLRPQVLGALADY